MSWWAGAAALPLFTRLDRDATLDHPRRKVVVEYIENNPGVRFHELKRALGIGHGALVHHLATLRDQGLIVFDRDGRQLRLRVPSAMRLIPEPPEAAALAREIAREPGRKLGELARALGWTRRKTAYWARRLRSREKPASSQSPHPRRLALVLRSTTGHD